MRAVSADHDPVFGCMLVTSRLDDEGYAYHGKSRAHIVAWSREHGPVPDDREIDHLCRRRHCIALHHLELVTRAENERRKKWRYRVARTRCPRGHDLERNRVKTPEDGIVCRACNRDHQPRSENT